MLKFWVTTLSFCLFFSPITSAKNAPSASRIDLKQNQVLSSRFFAKNKTKPGVRTLPSGLQYAVVKKGKGEAPRTFDFVKVRYKATLLNGAEFDNSEWKSAPSHLEVGATIPGLSEALQLMKPGAKWILYIPPKLAYGRKGLTGKVPPNVGVIYELSLIKVVPKPDNSVTDVLEELTED